MFKLDRTFSSSGNIYQHKKESEHYKGLSLKEIGKVFAYLQSVAYQYPADTSLKMDRTVHSYRK